jgi:hypothetical protein
MYAYHFAFIVIFKCEINLCLPFFPLFFFVIVKKVDLHSTYNKQQMVRDLLKF